MGRGGLARGGQLSGFLVSNSGFGSPARGGELIGVLFMRPGFFDGGVDVRLVSGVPRILAAVRASGAHVAHERGDASQAGEDEEQGAERHAERESRRDARRREQVPVNAGEPFHHSLSLIRVNR